MNSLNQVRFSLLQRGPLRVRAWQRLGIANIPIRRLFVYCCKGSFISSSVIGEIDPEQARDGEDVLAVGRRIEDVLYGLIGELNNFICRGSCRSIGVAREKAHVSRMEVELFCRV